MNLIFTSNKKYIKTEAKEGDVLNEAYTNKSSNNFNNSIRNNTKC